MISLLSTFFSLLALSLATIGLYGVMTYAVVRRTNEIGIRMALGAQKNSVLWMVLKESLLLLVIGGLSGISGTLASKRLIQSELFGLSAADPLTILQSDSVCGNVACGIFSRTARGHGRSDGGPALRVSRCQTQQTLLAGLRQNLLSSCVTITCKASMKALHFPLPSE